jgi:hypothetical protein
VTGAVAELQVDHDALAARVGLTAFAGYLFNRPDITYRNAAGQEFGARWRADSLVSSVGLVYSLF